jgi:hypothetical protein
MLKYRDGNFVSFYLCMTVIVVQVLLKVYSFRIYCVFIVCEIF